MAEITHRTIKTNGINMHIAEAGEGPLVLLLHGWPESWYSWRHQLPALAAAGYHAVAPDVRGYGQSDKPQAIEAYSMKNMLADYLGLLDALGEKTAVVVGHDWGAPMAWNSAALHPGPLPRRRRHERAAPRPRPDAADAAASRRRSATTGSTSSTSRSPASPRRSSRPTSRRRCARSSPASPDSTPAARGRAGEEEGRQVPHRHQRAGDAARLADRGRRRLLREGVRAAAASAAASTATATWTATGRNCRSWRRRRSNSPRCSSPARTTRCAGSPRRTA